MGSQLIEGDGVSRITGFRVPADQLVIIGVDTKHKSQAEHSLYDPRVRNVHKLFVDALAGDSESRKAAEKHSHVISMVEFGVIEPVLVQVEEIDGKDVCVVVDGRGRVLKMRVANEILKSRGQAPKPVPVFANRKNATLEKLALSLQIVLNEHRDEDTPMNRAQKAQYLIATGNTVESVATLFGKSPQTINDWMKLLEVIPAAQRAVDSGTISPSAAVKLHSLNRAEQEAALEQLVAEGGGKATTKKANAIVRGTKGGGTKAQPETVVAPSKRAIKKAIENGKGILSDDLILGLRIAIGDVGATRVKGLAALLRGETPSDAAE